MKEGLKTHHHRSSLKQRNKPFKGSTASRSKSRGRVDAKKKTGKMAHDLNKADRKNRMTMIQQQKRIELTRQRRMYSGKDGMPRIIAIVPVSGSVHLERLPSQFGARTYYSERNKQTLRFISCDRNKMSQEEWTRSIVDVIQIADGICFVASADDEEFDDLGRDTLSLIRAVGLSSAVAIVQALTTEKNVHRIKSSWLEHFGAHIPNVSKVYCGDSLGLQESREAIEMERILCQQRLNAIPWRDIRPYMLTDSVEVVSSVNNTHCTLKATGFMRGGRPFSADKLVYLPSLGDPFIVSKIVAVSGDGDSRSNEMDVDNSLAQVRDEMNAEILNVERGDNQSSSTTLHQVAETMMEDGGNSFKEHHAKTRVPKGTSSYQASWLEDEEPDEENEEYEELSTLEETTDDIDVEMDIDEHGSKLKEYKELQLSRRHFPDEIELDPSTSARTRLERYRGVQSLRTSTWDQNETLPPDYSRIFEFANYKQSRKAVLEENDSPFTVGQRVSLYIENVPIEIASKLDQDNVIFGLLKYEQKQTVMNFSFTCNSSYKGQLSNKQEMMAVIGFRKFMINPIFSEHTTQPLHKMVRNIDHDVQTMVVGTIFAPVSFTPAPILLFVRSTCGELKFVGNGSVLDLDPHRIILKRITLTGSPFKVHKRSAVVRFMFFSPLDVNWFKPVELVTRAGARGHIRESLGTHGYMKCIFNRTVFHHDVVAMHLYKRVFPNWTTRPYYYYY